MAIVTNVRVPFWKRKCNRIDFIRVTSTVTINKKKYKVISAIFHEDGEMNRNHYTCILRADKKSEWYYSNNLQVIKKRGI